MSKVSFDNSSRLLFQSIKKSADAYFSTQQLKKTGDWRLYTKAGILIPVAIALYICLLSCHYGAIWGLMMVTLLGFVLVGIAFNVMHDACHGSFSQRKWVNSCMGLSMNALGASAFLWKIKHNVIHHTYTNIDGVDDDIAHGPLLRQVPSQKWLPVHRFQVLYMFFLYALSTMAWVLATDFIKYFGRRIQTTKINKIDRKEHFIFWISKGLYAFFYVLLPLWCLGWEAWLVGFLIVNVVMGLTLSLVFQLAHTVEKTDSVAVAGEGNSVIESEWAVHEIKTTANFAAKNKVITWLIGGLNFQIEHHLFPQVSHVHYPALSKIVRKQCEAFGLPYNYYPSMAQAIVSHMRVMRNLGRATT